MFKKEYLQLAKRIKKIRQDKGFSQEYLAEKVGVSLGWMSKVERGKHSPNLRLLIKISHALEVKVRDLIPF